MKEPTPTKADKKAELIAVGREWLEYSPPAGPVAPDLIGMRGPVGFVCSICASRILKRGCDLKQLANVPVWSGGVEQWTCALCNPTLAAIEKVEG